MKKPWVMCDSTFATPFHQRCLETRGVDVAIHSATKYTSALTLGGPSWSSWSLVPGPWSLIPDP